MSARATRLPTSRIYCHDLALYVSRRRLRVNRRLLPGLAFHSHPSLGLLMLLNEHSMGGGIASKLDR